MRGKEMPWLLLMIYCLKCERCLSFRAVCRSSLAVTPDCNTLYYPAGKRETSRVFVLSENGAGLNFLIH